MVRFDSIPQWNPVGGLIHDSCDKESCCLAPAGYWTAGLPGRHVLVAACSEHRAQLRPSESASDAR